MKCPNCEYLLWNLKERRCPECGQDFAPSQFRFLPRTVRFCCPHCDQQYFGTGVDGHLVPREFDCVRCGVHIQMDEMVLSPAEGYRDEQTTIELNAWLNGQRNFFSRWIRTLGGGLGVPKRTIDRTPPQSSGWAAFGFAALNLLVALGIGIGGITVFTLFAAGFSARGRGMGLAGGMAIGFLGFFAALYAGMLVWLVVCILISHGLLILTGKTDGGFRRTTQCLCYASAPNMLYAIPCLNYLIWPVVAIWTGISSAIMLAHGQKVSALRASVAALTPHLLAGVAVAALIMGYIVPVYRVAVVAAATTATQAGVTLQSMRVQTMAAQIDSIAKSRGAYPAHTLELFKSGQVSATDFSFSTNPMVGDNIPVGNTTLGRLETLSSQQRSVTIQAIVDSLPSGIVAHRIGDYVFTYHGLNAAAADPGLWVFIAEPTASPTQPSPSPASSPYPSPYPPSPSTYFVGLPGGSAHPIATALFPAALKQQNELRASFGLPPIPDPSTVTPSAPAIAPK